MITCACGSDQLEIGRHKLTCTVCHAEYCNVRFENPIGSGNWVFIWQEYCSKCKTVQNLSIVEKQELIAKATKYHIENLMAQPIMVTMDYKDGWFTCTNCGCQEQRKFITNKEAQHDSA